MHQNLFLDRVADNIDNEASAFEIQGDGPSDRFRRRASNHHYFEPGPIPGLLGSPFLAVSLLSYQHICNATNRDQPECHLDLVRGNPVLDSSEHRGGGGGLVQGPGRRRWTRTCGLWEPWRRRE